MNRLTVAAFAATIGASEAAVGKWARGERIPRRAMMVRIQEATGGQVTAADFYAPATTPPARGAEQVAA
jgi:DNA-binding transcriptional regulator YdaS (Cro superfamily)